MTFLLFPSTAFWWFEHYREFKRHLDANYLEVFRVAGTTAFLGYAAAQVQDSIWKGQPWGVTLKHVLDGLIYALLTAGTFGWLWPR